MNSRWYNIAVVLLWLATMTWLVKQKILPALLIGDPPHYETILEAQRQNPIVGWGMRLNDRPLGWAVTTTTRLPQGMTRVESTVHVEPRHVAERLPGGLRRLLGLEDASDYSMDIGSTLVFDSFDDLSWFESSIRFQGAEDPIKVRGHVEGGSLDMMAHYGSMPPMEQSIPLPRKTILNDTFSPQANLPGLRRGQTWTLRVVRPLHPKEPTEIIQASVEERQPIVWNDQTVDAWLVVYRGDQGEGAARPEDVRGRAWVLPDEQGTVVMQEVRVLGATLTFVRLPEDEAARLAEKAAEQRKRMTGVQS